VAAMIAAAAEMFVAVAGMVAPVAEMLVAVPEMRGVPKCVGRANECGFAAISRSNATFAQESAPVSYS
jgi:hypothetical protein